MRDGARGGEVALAPGHAADQQEHRADHEDQVGEQRGEERGRDGQVERHEVIGRLGGASRVRLGDHRSALDLLDEA